MVLPMAYTPETPLEPSPLAVVRFINAGDDAPALTDDAIYPTTRSDRALFTANGLSRLPTAKIMIMVLTRLQFRPATKK